MIKGDNILIEKRLNLGISGFVSKSLNLQKLYR
jgi:hypothetical protein